MRDESAQRSRNARARTVTFLVVVAFLSSALAWYVLGFGATLVLASTWMLAAGIGRIAPGLRGPAIWALAIIAEFVSVVGQSVVVALLSPHAHSRLVFLGMLAAPGVAGFALWLVAGRWTKFSSAKSEYSRWGVALAITWGVLGVAAVIASRSEYSGIAWAMSGDARNHGTFMRAILADGGLTLDLVKSYPAALNAFAATLAGSADRTGGPGNALLADAQALAATYVLAAIAIATLLAGALLQFLPKRMRRLPQLPPSILATVCVAASAAGSPFVLGMALAGGAFSSYGALPIALASAVVALQFLRSPRASALLLVANAVALVLTFITWPLLAIVPASLLVLMIYFGVAREVRARSGGEPPASHSALWRWIAIAFATLTLLALSGIFIHLLPRLKASFVLPGASQQTSNTMLVFLGLVAFGMMLLADRRGVRRQLLAPLAVAIGGGLTLYWLLSLSGPVAPWSYYALKTNWVVSVCLFWVPFVPLVLHLSRRGVARPSSTNTRRLRALAATSGAVGVLALLGSATSAAEPLRPALRGWTQPSPAIVGEVIQRANAGEPFVLWEWSDPGNDRLGNFWGALGWGIDASGVYIPLPPGHPGGFQSWAYLQSTDVAYLCTLVEVAPGIDVITNDADLQGELALACPGAQADVIDDEDS